VTKDVATRNITVKSIRAILPPNTKTADRPKNNLNDNICPQAKNKYLGKGDNLTKAGKVMDTNVCWVFKNITQFMRLWEQHVLQSKSIKIRQSKRERKRLVNLKTTDYKVAIFFYKMGHFFSISHSALQKGN